MTTLPPSSSPDARRLASVISAVIIVISLVGFIAGLRRDLPEGEADVAVTPVSDGRTPAPDYGQLLARGPVRNWGGGSGIQGQLNAPLPMGHLPDSPGGVAQGAHRERQALRAYDGAPPTIPHAVAPRGLPCLSCHEQGGAIGTRIAPAISHQTLTSCTQCHAPVAGGGPPEMPGLEDSVGASTFTGLVAPDGGARAWPGAPPTIPHASFMRERCESCHGPTGTAAIKSSHPWRQSCTQCHTPSATLDQQPGWWGEGEERDHEARP